MPAFCARWPDGSFSIVEARDGTHALILLDELGDEPAELWRLKSCLLDFELTEGGQIRIQQFGEETGPEILGRAYPLLSKALGDEEFSEHAMPIAANGRSIDQKQGRFFAKLLLRSAIVW